MRRGSIQLLVGIFLLLFTVLIARSGVKNSPFFGVAASLSFLVGLLFLFFGARKTQVFVDHQSHALRIIRKQQFPTSFWIWFVILMFALLAPVSPPMVLFGFFWLVVFGLVWLAFNEAKFFEEAVEHYLHVDKSVRREEIAWFAIVLTLLVLMWVVTVSVL